jgi:hypothetical protein
MVDTKEWDVRGQGGEMTSNRCHCKSDDGLFWLSLVDICAVRGPHRIPLVVGDQSIAFVRLSADSLTNSPAMIIFAGVVQISLELLVVA